MGKSEKENLRKGGRELENFKETHLNEEIEGILSSHYKERKER